MSDKKVIDSIGSVDDYGAKAEFPILQPTPTNPSPSGKPILHWETDKQSVRGYKRKSKSDEPNYLIEERETKKGIQRTVWPLKPYCKWCSPAAERPDDTQWTSGWSDDGAEVRMTKREARLTIYPHKEYYSFTLIERMGKVICSVCENSPEVGGFEEEIVTIKSNSTKSPTTLDPLSPQLGIKLNKSVARFPCELVSQWVERGSLKNGTLVFAKGDVLHSIPASEFLRKAVLDESNNEWLLGLAKCLRTPCLHASVVGDWMTVEQDTLLSWRKTAISVKHIIASEYQGVTYTVSLSSFLAGGENNGSKWRIPLSECEGPFFMTMGDLYSQRRSNPRIEMKEKPRGKQTDLFDYE